MKVVFMHSKVAMSYFPDNTIYRATCCRILELTLQVENDTRYGKKSDYKDVEYYKLL